MSLRDRKRARTRQALIDAATDLFERNGYDETTVADIAAAAEIATRTFFGYFASKDELLFPDADGRVEATVEALANRKPGDRPIDILLQALAHAGDVSGETVSRLTTLRLRLIQTVPAVRGRALQIQLDTERRIAAHLAEAFPDQLDDVGARALTGAFVGAVSGAVQAVLERTGELTPAARQAASREAVEVALAPWLAQRG
ncbi:TetR/AcrR family transcriptional regulator [Amycolatopsis jejuensis]|uniref:TetR/AcrR family transcriptional regulator n=1 Tax=Amycolatopsis jejuensis TaxID=330084 RepID=UPI000A84F95D|nr:TetR/AcrR family transcriptional regulator [Amycolatopsis jejuensis]